MRYLFLSLRPRWGRGYCPLQSSDASAVRKVVVDPFDIIYRYFAEQDLVYVVGLVHQRAAQ